MAHPAKRARSGRSAAAAKRTGGTLKRRLSHRSVHRATPSRPGSVRKKTAARSTQAAKARAARPKTRTQRDMRRTARAVRQHAKHTAYAAHKRPQKKVPSIDRHKPVTTHRHAPTRYGARHRHAYSRHAGPHTPKQARSSHRPHNGTSHYDQYA